VLKQVVEARLRVQTFTKRYQSQQFLRLSNKTVSLGEASLMNWQASLALGQGGWKLPMS
jgi:hypothetical protein